MEDIFPTGFSWHCVQDEEGKEKAPGDAQRELSLFEFLLERIANKRRGWLEFLFFDFNSEISPPLSSSLSPLK